MCGFTKIQLFGNLLCYTCTKEVGFDTPFPALELSDPTMDLNNKCSYLHFLKPSITFNTHVDNT